LAAAAPLVFDMPNAHSGLLSIGHMVLGLAFLATAYRCDPSRHADIKNFYMMFWVLFFLEYALFAVAFWL
jgi:homogentisate phytyltransferase/homogentisate geranylgeranyltransferase